MSLVQKWEKVLDTKALPPINNRYKKMVTAVLLENTQQYLNEERRYLAEAAPANVTANVDKFDPVLINMLRRSQPNLMAFETMAVQPLKMPTGLIFAMKARFGSGGVVNTSSTEALFNDFDTDFTGTGTHVTNIDPIGSMTYGTGKATADGEADAWPEMGFTIEKISVEAKTRQVKAEYSHELAQDMKNVHGMDTDSILSEILSQELTGETNRQLQKIMYKVAKAGAQTGTASAGIFDLDTDSDGRWSVERFKGLLFHIDREANSIARDTRRGRGNFLICSSDVASALALAGRLDYSPALKTDLDVDDTGNTFAGTLDGKYKVYIDPYYASATNRDMVVIGYKGNQFDAGLYFCPYVPLMKVQAQDPNNFSPKIGFKTRYGVVGNPYYSGGALTANENGYFRRVIVTNLL